MHSQLRLTHRRKADDGNQKHKTEKTEKQTVEGVLQKHKCDLPQSIKPNLLLSFNLWIYLYDYSLQNGSYQNLSQEFLPSPSSPIIVKPVLDPNVRTCIVLVSRVLPCHIWH